MNTILTDDEIQAKGRNGFGIDPILDGNLMKFARAVEAAVLAKLAQQEPVAWHTEDHLTDRSATTYSKEAMQRWKGKGWPVTPLYTHPTPQQADRQQGPDGWKLVPMEPGEWVFADKVLGHDSHPNHKERMRRLYRAMLAAAPEAPATAVVQVPQAVAYLDVGAGGYLDLGSDLTDEQLQELPKGRHMLAIVGTFGVDGYTPAAPEAPAQAKPCLVKGDCKHDNWCSETYCQEHCQFVKSAQASAVDERAEFEAWLGIKPCGAAHEFAWAAWLARAALAQKGGAA